MEPTVEDGAGAASTARPPLRTASRKGAQRSRRTSLSSPKPAHLCTGALTVARVVPGGAAAAAAGEEGVSVWWQTTGAATVEDQLQEPGDTILVAAPASVIYPVSGCTHVRVRRERSHTSRTHIEHPPVRRSACSRRPCPRQRVVQSMLANVLD